ncbi:MAG: hypothetical protein HY553_01490 [Elusimicrobia bacterium]|nr:hypothetical protein [Elusimicrobiota bacterium]
MGNPWFALLWLAASAHAVPIRDAGREQPASIEGKTERFTEFFLNVGSYVGNAGNVSARPDGSDAARQRTQLYLRDRSGGDLSHVIADLIFLHDASRKFKPASLDYYLGYRKQSESGRWLAVGRDEALPLGRSGKSSRTWDLRVGRSWLDAGAFGLFAGWYFKNDGRPARPDQSGEAYLRYSTFLVSARGPVTLRVHGDFLTDERRRRYRPASLDLNVAAALNYKTYEVSVAYNPWYPFDGARGVVESWLVSFAYRFDGRTVWDAIPH